MTEIKYKEEIANVQRGAGTDKPITFAVDAKRFTPRTESAPLMYYNDYARFVFSIINKGGNRLQAQIRPQEVPLLSKKYRYALQNIMDKPLSVKSSATSKAATVKIAMRGGKTAVQLLSEGIKPEDLEYTKGILEQNVSRYPKNQEQIDAINEAIELQKSGNLSETSVADSGIIPLYKSEYRYMTGLEQGTRNNYTFSIECNTREQTFIFSIKNAIVKVENGIAGTDVIKTLNQYFTCTLQEFDEVIEAMQRTMRWFEMFYCMPQGKLYNTPVQKTTEPEEPDFN